MTENQKQLKIAFITNIEKGYKEQEVWQNSYHYKEQKNLKDNSIFEATLTYGGFTRGRSSLNIKWIDQQRKLIYYSGMNLLDQALMRGFVEGNKISGTFCFKKQGTSILLQQI